MTDREVPMGCFAVLFALAVPRFTLFILQVFTDRLAIAMPSFVVGLLGFVLLPYTTVFYALAYDPRVGVEGIGWFVVAIGFVMDLSSHFGGYREQRNRYATY